ncbi:hypothetical protein C7S16_5553 [Burkholderia thailandensis]|uniref:Uncharacterized protein n=1 Tax=Burkholderia thailandensis TaxID=57975 RepID=A0AAW9CMI5_BURTH|nr:hypothetical protein [Burkholderia thailandensis]MDW9252160.1 hypothetical protein [Burkholderia thailandensis]
MRCTACDAHPRVSRLTLLIAAYPLRPGGSRARRSGPRIPARTP